MYLEVLNYENVDIANAEQKEAIEQIDALNIGALQRACLVLVELGVKPATEIDIAPWNDPPQKVERVMHAAKILYKETGRSRIDEGEVVSYVVAKDKEALDAMLGLDPSKDHEAYGHLMGFPDTAVAAFGTPHVLDEDALSAEDQRALEGMAVHFTLSKENWREELRLQKYWTDLLKKYAPQTYSNLVPTGQ